MVGFVLAWGGSVLAGPPVLPDVPSREVEVTAGIGDVSAPDRGLVVVSDGSGTATLLVREAGHLRSQRSSDSGASFLREVEVSTEASRPVLDHKAVLAPDGSVVAVWAAPDPAGDRALYLARSADHGATWSAPVAVVHAGIPGHGAELFAVAAGSGGRTAVVWSDGATQSVHGRVTLDGTTWQPAVPIFTALEEGGTEIQSLDVGMSPAGEVHVVLVQDRLDGTFRLYTSRSAKSGATFEPAVERTQLFPGASPRPLNADLEVDDDGTVLIATLLRSAFALGLLRSTDGGVTFAGSAPVSIQSGPNSVVPALTTWPGTAAVALRAVDGRARGRLGLSFDGGQTFHQAAFGLDAQRGGLGSAVARLADGRVAIAWIEHGGTETFPPLPSGVYAFATPDGTVWSGGRADDSLTPFQRVPVSLAMVAGPQAATVIWEDPRPDGGTTSVWRATASTETMQFDTSVRVDADAFTSRPNAFPQPTIASDGMSRVLTVFPAAGRSELNDLYVAISADGGRTFAPPQRVGSDPLGMRNNLAPAAALGHDGVGWVLSEVTSPTSNFPYALRLFRTADYGATFPEEPISLQSSTYDGLVHVAMTGMLGVAVWVDSELQTWLAHGGGPGTPLTQTLLSVSGETAAVCADGAVTVVYQEGDALVGKWSRDGGETFDSAFSVHAHPQYVHVACAGEQATAVWLDPGQGGIQTATLHRDGWSDPVTLGPASFAIPTVLRRGGMAFAAWDENGKIWSALSLDSGATWEPAKRLDESDPGGVHDPLSWNVVIATDVTGHLWAFWEEKLGAEASIVVRRLEAVGWGKIRRLSREVPQHAFERHGYPYNARAATVPGAALLAYAGPLTSDWRSVFVNADDANDADRDGYPNHEDCAPEDPDHHLCNSPPVAAAGPDQTVECSGALHAVVHLDGTGSSDPDGDLASYLWNERGAPLADTAVADVPLGLGAHTLTLEVTDTGRSWDSDDMEVSVVDTQPPFGGLTFPAQGACFGPAELPVRIEEDAADVCDPAPERTVTPGASFDTHGDHVVTLHVEDAAGLALDSDIGFTIDTAPPVARIVRTSERIDPGHLPLVLTVAGSDDDGASGGVVRERVYLNGCLALDGLMPGGTSLGLDDLCSLAARCGFARLTQPELRFEAVDCGGNVGTATVQLKGTFAAGVCRSRGKQR